MSNFTIIGKDYKDLSNIGVAAEKDIYSSPRTSLTSFGTFAELLTKEICHLDGIEYWNLKQIDLLDKLTRSSNDYPATVLLALNNIRKLRNRASHDNDFHATSDLALEADKNAFTAWKWFLEIFSQENAPEYQEPENKEELVQSQENKIKELEAKIKTLQAQQPVVKVTEQERQTRRQINQRYAKNHPLTEAETRELIDEQLRKAGWEVDTNTLNNWKNKTMPQKGHNMAISEWILSNGERADYALFLGKKLVGVVEAKKFDTDIAGQMAQPKEYSRNIDSHNDEIELVEDLKNDYHVPFIYATNGREYSKQYEEKSGIWFWDSRNPEERSKALAGFHSPEDLKLKLTAVSKKEANESLSVDQDYPEFAARYYQIEAVKAIEDGIKAGRKRMLLAMATGTGKTRTALSLMYRLLKHKRARRILYLVDRNSLGEQTANAAKDNKVEGLPLASIYGMKELKEKLPEASTKIQIATVQGMIKRLFYHDSESEKMETPSIGAYDFIIVDEAHRGYNQDSDMSEKDERLYDQNEYISQYRRVVDYFDATAIGLTATPALQTTQIFGKPVYTYSYTQAVLDEYLVDHDAPHIIDTKLSKEGIHLKKGENVAYFDPNKNAVDYAELPDDMDFDLKDFNNHVITPGFNKAVAEYLAKKLDPHDSELGKTLIFAANDQHADMIVTQLKKAFEQAGNPVSDDAIEKITGSIRHPNEEIRRFKNEQYPNIAVTVDLLSTGIDVPEITTLVFMRQIKSRILYEQMLGRATRLCPEIHKDHFTIYDAVGIYDAMQKVSDMKPVATNPHHDVKYFLDHKDYFEVNSDEENSHQYQIDMAAAVGRKVKRLDEQKRKDFERLAQVNSADNWARNLSKMSTTDFVKEWDKFKILNNLPSHRQVQIISTAKDEVVNEERSYGSRNNNPEDYLESFNNYIKNNLNEIAALDIIATRPKDLTLKELREISNQLESQGFKERDLQTAWKNTSHTQTTANIISFIRQAALGLSLIEPEERINRAMKKIEGMGEWTNPQQKWLKYIAKRLKVSKVLGPNAEHALNDEKWLAGKGGYKVAQKVFKDAPISLEEIIETLNNDLYA